MDKSHLVLENESEQDITFLELGEEVKRRKEFCFISPVELSSKASSDFTERSFDYFVYLVFRVWFAVQNQITYVNSLIIAWEPLPNIKTCK